MEMNQTFVVRVAVPLLLMDLSLDEGPVGWALLRLLHTNYKAGMAHFGETGFSCCYRKKYLLQE